MKDLPLRIVRFSGEAFSSFIEKRDVAGVEVRIYSPAKLVEDHHGDTYRAAYTVALRHAVYVLHVFKKKSKSGVATPQPDKDLIRQRLKAAQAHHGSVYEGE